MKIHLLLGVLMVTGFVEAGQNLGAGDPGAVFTTPNQAVSREVNSQGQGSGGKVVPRGDLFYQPYYYVIPKAATRAAIARQRNARIHNQPSAGGGGVVVGNPALLPVEPPIQTNPIGAQEPFRPLPAPVQRRIYLPASPLPTNSVIPLAGPPQPSVYASSGPLFGEIDPLVEYQKEQAAKGNPQSQFALGVRYLTGNGIEQNEELGREWLEKSAKGGEIRAHQKLRELVRSAP